MIVFRNKKLDRFVRIFLFVAILAALVFELIRDSQRAGDFMGYVNAGNSVIHQTPIYADYLNTWPPFFSVFSVPLAVGHNLTAVGIRILWLLAMIVSWFYIVRYCSQVVFNRRLHLRKNEEGLQLTDWVVLIPLLLVFRFIIDDLSNIQINTFLLASCLLIFHWFEQGKRLLSGLLLGVIIALKVYPIFLLVFFIARMKWKVVLAAVFGLVLAFLTTVLVFGLDQSIEYHQQWVFEKAMGATIMTHKNQSVFPLMEGLLTEQSRGLGIQYNITSFSAGIAKKLTFFVIGLLALIPAKILLLDGRAKDSRTRFGEFAFVFACMPVLSPLAWKYYFVFLYPLYVYVWNLVFIEGKGGRGTRVLFLLSVAISILSTDGLLGVYVSDVLEVFGCITVATFLMLSSYVRVESSIRVSKSL